VVFAKYNQNDQVKENEMGRACSTNGGIRGMYTEYQWENKKKGDHWEDQNVGGWIILKWISEREREKEAMGWYALIYLRIGNSRGLL
jgi:hypothetical protein